MSCWWWNQIALHTFIYIYIHIYIYIYICLYIYLYINIYMYMYIYICIHINVYKYVINIYINMNIWRRGRDGGGALGQGDRRSGLRSLLFFLASGTPTPSTLHTTHYTLRTTHFTLHHALFSLPTPWASKSAPFPGPRRAPLPYSALTSFFCLGIRPSIGQEFDQDSGRIQ